MINEKFKAKRQENVYSILINPTGFEQQAGIMSKLEHEYNAELSALKRSVFGNKNKNNDQKISKYTSKNDD